MPFVATSAMRQIVTIYGNFEVSKNCHFWPLRTCNTYLPFLATLRSIKLPGLHLASSEKNWQYCGGAIVEPVSFGRLCKKAVRLGKSPLVSRQSSLNSVADSCFGFTERFLSFVTPKYARSSDLEKVLPKTNHSAVTDHRVWFKTTK